MGQGVQPFQRPVVLRRDPQPVHPGVQRQMDGEGEPPGRQGLSVVFVHHGLGEPPPAEQRGLLRGRIAQDQDLAPDAHPAQVHPLRQTGHRESLDALLLQPVGHGKGSVAVGVGFHHRHQAAAGGQGPLEHPGVVGQGVQIHVPPGPAHFFTQAPLPLSGCGAAGPPRCSPPGCPERPPPPRRSSPRHRCGCPPPVPPPRR